MDTGMDPGITWRDEIPFTGGAAQIQRATVQKLLQEMPVYFYHVLYREGVPVSVYHSPQCETITGYKPEEYYFDPMLWSKMIYDPDKPAVLRRLNDRSGKKRTICLEHRIITKTGNLRWVLNEHTLMVNETEATSQEIGILLDITQLKKTVEQTERFFSLPLDIMCILGEDGRFLRVNPSFRALLGYTEKEVAGTRLAKFVHPDDLEAAETGTLAGVPENGKDGFEARFKCKDGSYRHLLWKTARVGSENSIYCTAMDITGRKNAERSLKEEKERAVEATRVKDQFVAIVAHDLKGPLSTMLGFLRLFRKGFTQPARRESDRLLDKVMECGNQMSLLINDILDLGRLRSGTVKADRKFLNVNLLAGSVIADNSDAAVKKGISLINDVPENMRLYTDRTMLKELLQNLIGNSVKFCGNGDGISISAGSGDMPSITVRDTGPGIDPMMKEKVFNEKFTSQGTEGEKGSGYGLILVKNLASFLGAGIACENGNGTAFTIRFPRIKPRVLVADHDGMFRTFAARCLDSLDAETIEASNGREALLAISEHSPHLVIADIDLPETTGIELLARLRRDDDTRSLPVIMVSGGDRDWSPDNSIVLGAQDFFKKDGMTLEHFIPRIRRFIA